MEDIKGLLEDFMSIQLDKDIKIYNEISLQLELGSYLREKGYTVRFERNIEYYIDSKSNCKKSDFVKKEIDIVAYKTSVSEDEKSVNNKIAIELKFPRKGQYPEQMFAFVKDIKFMEQVKTVKGFKETYVLSLVDDHNFYLGETEQGSIYSYFRNKRNNISRDIPIKKPTGKNKDIDKIQLENDYIFEWQEFTQEPTWLDIEDKDVIEYRYYIIECK